MNVWCLIKNNLRNWEWEVGKEELKNEKSMKRHIHCWGHFCGHWALVVSAPPEKHTEKNVLEVFTWSMEFRNIYPIGCFLLPPFHFTVSQEMHHQEIFCLGKILLGLASSNKIQSRKRSSIAPFLGLEDNQQWKEHLLQDLQVRVTAEYWKEQQLDLHVCLLEIWQQLNRS